MGLIYVSLLRCVLPFISSGNRLDCAMRCFCSIHSEDLHRCYDLVSWLTGILEKKGTIWINHVYYSMRNMPGD